jgi:hypothetical protein
MVKIKDLSFLQPKILPTLQTINDFGIEFNPALRCFNSISDGRPLKVLQTDNGKEFTNNKITNWMNHFQIKSQYCEKDDKKCLGVGERFNRTIKLMIEKYLTSVNSNRWIDKLDDFVEN